MKKLLRFIPALLVIGGMMLASLGGVLAQFLHLRQVCLRAGRIHSYPECGTGAAQRQTHARPGYFFRPRDVQ